MAFGAQRGYEDCEPARGDEYAQDVLFGRCRFGDRRLLDAWAGGENGYLKQDAVIAAFTAAGFEFVEASEINANPKDQPTENDFVWRLPPTLATSGANPELKAQMEAIGESDRMT
ncbi:MAG: hypothetical protein ABL957_16480, partial [Parvularculaceae bacterium]